MKVVFLCNRLSRTKLRGSWQALLEASGQGAGAGAGAGGGASGEEVNQAGSEPSTCGKTVKGEVEVRPGGVTLVRDRRLASGLITTQAPKSPVAQFRTR